MRFLFPVCETESNPQGFESWEARGEILRSVKVKGVMAQQRILRYELIPLFRSHGPETS